MRRTLLALAATTAATALVVLNRAAAAPEGDGDGDGHEAENTYGLPDGKPIRSELQRWFRRQARAILGTIPPKVAPLPDRFPPLADYDDKMASAMTPILALYWDRAGRTTRERLGLDPDEWKVTNPHLAGEIRRASLAFCRETNATTSKALDAALSDLRDQLHLGLVDHGETIPELTRRVQDVFDTASRARAERIARTEATRAVHAAQVRAAEESGVVAGFEWLVSSDACPLCLQVAAEVKRVRVGEAFAVVGHHAEYATVRHPPLHPNDRCSLLEVLKPEYGGPADPEWGRTLIQPRPGPDYSPPEGTPEPRPDPDAFRRAAPAAVRGRGPLAGSLRFVLDEISDHRGDSAVLADVARLDAALAADAGYHVGPGGLGPSARPGAYDRAREFLARAEAEGTPVAMPRVAVDAAGQPTLADGRHRWAALRDAGATAVPVAVARGEADAFRARFGPRDRDGDQEPPTP